MKTLLVAVILAAMMFCGIAASGSPAATNPVPAKAHIAPFADLTAGRAWEGIDVALRDLLAVAVSRDSAVALVDRQNFDKILREHKLALKALLDPATAARVGKLLGADRMVTGSVMMPGGAEVLVVAHVLDVHSAVVLRTCQARGRSEELQELTIDLGRQVAEALKAPFAPDAAVALDRTPLASLHFLRGLGYFHAGNGNASVLEFMTCLDVDPDHPVARYWLGCGYAMMGEFEHAQIELERFLRSAPPGPDRDAARKLLDGCRERIKEAGRVQGLHPGGAL